MPTSETVLQKTSLTWRLQPKPHCRGHGSTYRMVVKLLRWCTSNFLEFSRDFQESPPKVCHGMLFTGRSLGRHSTANSPEGVPWKTTCSWVLSAVMSAGIRLEYAHTAGAGPRGDTHSAEPGERRMGEPSKGASSTPSTLQSPPLEQLNIMVANKREPFTETICILA